jgi:hypothetical protein
MVIRSGSFSLPKEVNSPFANVRSRELFLSNSAGSSEHFRSQSAGSGEHFRSQSGGSGEHFRSQSAGGGENFRSHSAGSGEHFRLQSAGSGEHLRSVCRQRGTFSFIPCCQFYPSASSCNCGSVSRQPSHWPQISYTV